MKLTTGFGDRLVELRKNHPAGLSKADVARMTGITKSGMGGYEKKVTADKLEVQHIAALANIFGTTVEYLIFGRTPAPAIDTNSLAFALDKVQDLLPKANAEKQAKLVNLIYDLKESGQDVTPEILTAVYRTL